MSNMMKLRVVKEVFDEDGHPVIDPSTGKPMINGGSYAFAGPDGRSRAYMPGEVFEMPEEVALQELQLCGQSVDVNGHRGRRPLLERFEDYERRERARQAMQAEQVPDRDIFERQRQKLEEEGRAARELRERIMNHQNQRAGAAPVSSAEDALSQLFRRMEVLEKENQQLRAQQQAPAQTGKGKG